MNLPEGWPTEAMIAEAEGLEYDFTPGGSETVTGYVSEEMAREIFEKMYAAAPTPPAQERIELPHFDAGSLPDFIDGDAELWQDAIRNLLEVAHEHYQEQADDLLSMPAQEDEPVAWQIEYTNTGLGFKLRKIHTDNVLDAYVETYPDAVAIPLYTRPDDDKLRKAVGEHLAFVHRDGGHHRQKVGDIQAIEDATNVVLADRQQLMEMENLRKAAEEFVKAYSPGWDHHGIEEYKNLCAALERK